MALIDAISAQGSLSKLQLAVKKHAIPQLQKALASSKAATHKLLSHPQVRQTTPTQQQRANFFYLQDMTGSQMFVVAL